MHGWLWELLEMLAERKEFFPRVLGVLEKKVSVVGSFFINDDAGALRLKYGRWSGYDDEVILRT